MEPKLERYYQLKQMQKEIEQELSELRNDIVSFCNKRGLSELDTEQYTAKLVPQQRKEYDERKLYEALPDPELWRMLSKPDVSKIASLIKLNVIAEENIKNTYEIKNVILLHVDKK